jgi:TolB protein
MTVRVHIGSNELTGCELLRGGLKQWIPSPLPRPMLLHLRCSVLFLLVSAGVLLAEYPSASSLGAFEGSADVGAVKIPGRAVYDPEQQFYTLTGSGTNMWGQQDEFQFVWKRVTGDFIVQALTEFLGQGVDPHRKLGIIVRSSLDGGSPHVNACRHGDGLTSFQFRRVQGGITEEVKFELTGPEVLQIERRGNRFTMSAAKFGQPFISQSLEEVVLGESVYVGLYVCSHNNDVSETAIFRNVRLVRPAKIGFVPYREYIGSDLEVLDVTTGVRQVLHHAPDSLQAPNWTPDGTRLIYNHNGRMFGFRLADKAVYPIDTGAQVQNNNDHALSFDGKFLGISSGQPSTVYVVPINGGTPRQVTAQNPSYLHGWSPNGRYLIYTGIRNGEADIYRISVKGGKEKRLTHAKGLDDGSEYTPNGRYIYFNSERSGRMQIWRMRANGSQQEQVTHDEFNNWFPHVSPDGKSIVFLSYGAHVPPGDHPFYEHVYLRQLDLSTGTARVVAYVYGGQGSINVNSWSPDSRYIAFVSNGDRL